MINIPYNVKRALRMGQYKKNYKFNIYVDEVYAFTIDNDTLVRESVIIDERMCTGDRLKFGLCEGSTLQFQYFNHPNITGNRIQAFISVEYIDDNKEHQWYDIPMGWYTVDECSLQFSTGIRKVTAYNKLKSDYLDEKANSLLIEEYGDSEQYVFDILETMLEGYSIRTTKKEELANPFISSDSEISSSYFNYTSIFDGDQGVFSHVFDDLTTSTRMHFAFVKHRVFYDHLSSESYYRCDCDFDFDAYEQECVELIKSQLAKMHTNKTADELWGQMKTAFAKSCCIRVEYYNIGQYRFKYYGYTGYTNGVSDFIGTFRDFFKTTNNNVVAFEFYFPDWIRVDKYDSDSAISNQMLLLADEQSVGIRRFYEYYESDEYSRPTGYGFYDVPQFIQYQDPTWERLLSMLHFYKVLDLTEAELIKVDVENIPDVTLRDLQTATYETQCQYGQLDRVTDLFSGIELNDGGIYPAETLYPADNLYPGGKSVHPFPSEYQKLWTDTVGVQSFRYLIITYKTTETVDGRTQEVEKTLQRTVNSNGTTDYNMSDNWLFRNLIWTPAQIGEYADAMVTKMRKIQWFPFEMWCTGLPYVETGDAIEITDKEGVTYLSYILTRRLKGIQNLQDTFVDGELDIF